MPRPYVVYTMSIFNYATSFRVLADCPIYNPWDTWFNYGRPGVPATQCCSKQYFKQYFKQYLKQPNVSSKQYFKTASTVCCKTRHLLMIRWICTKRLTFITDELVFTRVRLTDINLWVTPNSKQSTYIMWTSWCLKSLGTQLFVQHLFKANIKGNSTSPQYCPFLGGGGGPLVTRGVPSQRTSNAESVSMPWCHHTKIRYILVNITSNLII